MLSMKVAVISFPGLAEYKGAVDFLAGAAFAVGFTEGAAAFFRGAFFVAFAMGFPVSFSI
jgi:hypothetical protein